MVNSIPTLLVTTQLQVPGFKPRIKYGATVNLEPNNPSSYPYFTRNWRTPQRKPRSPPIAVILWLPPIESSLAHLNF